MDDEGRDRPFGTGLRPLQRIRADLERRGVEEPLAELLASGLADLAPRLSGGEYQAALLATAATYEVLHREGLEFEDRCRDVREIQRLMQGFVGELRKLEEGLRIVSAYLVRLRSAADGDSGGAVH